jgi:hypothetical protein
LAHRNELTRCARSGHCRHSPKGRYGILASEYR